MGAGLGGASGDPAGPVPDVVGDADAVRVLGSGEQPDPETVLVTRDHVRPTYRDGLLVLTADPAVGGTLVPFEHPSPRPCCGDHA